jgi:NAD-dependent SIR2 family protein deacetylase
MGKNVRRGHASNVRCASCGQLTRRDRSVYLFRDGIKAYYCPDCAKKIHGSRLYKGMPKFIRHSSAPKVKRKFAMYSKSDEKMDKNEIKIETTTNETEEPQNENERPTQ